MPEERTQQPETQQRELEARAYSAVAAGLARYAQWQSLSRSAAKAGVEIERFMPQSLVQRNERATRDLQTLAVAVDALARRTAQLQRWRIGSGPVVWGVKKGNAMLGQWQPVATQVLKLAGTAALTSTAWHLADLFGGSSKVETESKQLQIDNANACQQTAQQLASAGHVPEAERVAVACMEAAQAAAKPPPGLLDNLVASAGAIVPTAAAAISGAALLAIGLAFMASRRKGGKSYRYQHPVVFHKPATFRRPWRSA